MGRLIWDKGPVAQTIARRLQDMIRSGELRPGQKLPSQRILAEQLNVSRPSLREALLTLETLGLVQTLPARGSFVTDPASRPASLPWRYDNAHDLRHVFQTRILITELAARDDWHAAAFADLAAVRCAVDQQLADLDAPLAGAREVAFFPPMTGG